MLYRKADQEAQKCKILERKINQLKYGKSTLMKKHREAEIKHREYTVSKSREIQALKKKERVIGNKLSKLETKCHYHRATLERKKHSCSKLNTKLKETEAHLMKLLDIRKREINRPESKSPTLKALEKSQLDPVSEEITSIKFLLEKIVSDRVEIIQIKEMYRSKMSEYGDLMQSLINEMKRCDELWKQKDPIKSICDEVAESEKKILGIEFKIELIGSELEDIGKKLCIENISYQQKIKMNNDNGEVEENVFKIVSKLSAPCARRILGRYWER